MKLCKISYHVVSITIGCVIGVIIFGFDFNNMSSVEYFNLSIGILFFVAYFYQIIYVFVSLFKKPKRLTSSRNHKFAFVICARNESTVIEGLLKSIALQDYPAELIDVFVVADNCTDDTGEIARKNGAIVLNRSDKKSLGKGHALKFAFDTILKDYAHCNHEAFIMVDADNLLDKNYVKEMNVTYDNGSLVSTSYRNSKNYSSNWISSGYSIWFLREARYLSQARNSMNSSCVVSGTGFYVAADLLKKNGGWKWFLLTEDIEFSAWCISNGIRIGYSQHAILYDEQPVTFAQSWTQRIRWAKGFYQVISNYGSTLLKGVFVNKYKMRLACYDLTMTIAPGMLLTFFVLIVNLSTIVAYPIEELTLQVLGLHTLFAIFFVFINYIIFTLTVGILTVVTERKFIHASLGKRLLSVLTFPIFMFTYIPIAVVSLFKKVKWTPTSHSINVSLEDFSKSGDESR